MRIKGENIDYRFAENKCLIRNQRLLVKLERSTNPTNVQQLVCYQLSAPEGKYVLTLQKKNYNVCYPERSRKALPTTNLALIE